MAKFIRIKPNYNTLLKAFAYLFLLCGLSSAALAMPQITDASTTQSCQYLDEVEGTSGYGKKFSWQDLAKDSALKQAEKLGASHVVWEKFYSVGAFNGIAVAKAYKCTS